MFERPGQTETEAIREELGSLYPQYADLWLLPLLDREGPVWAAASLRRLLSAESDRFRQAGDLERAERYQEASDIYNVALLALRGLGWPEVYHPPLVPYGVHAEAGESLAAEAQDARGSATRADPAEAPRAAGQPRGTQPLSEPRYAQGGEASGV
jgi:hypothetical protein